MIADKHHVNSYSIGLEGLGQAQSSFDKAARQTTASMTPQPANNADTVELSGPASAAVSLLSSKDQFSAEIGFVKTADKMEKQAIDLIA